MNNFQPLLSICIPTWNRAKYLKLSLDSFVEQIKDINLLELELYVSDNCSDDNTQTIVQDYIKKGLPITYNRNSENIGAARNFQKCMEWSSGKYILLLGDDDSLKPGSVKLILDKIRDKEYGLIYMKNLKKLEGECVEFYDKEQFLKMISFQITFMSSSIFRKDILSTINYEKYIGTHLIQVPYYIGSALSCDKNLIINQTLLSTGLDHSNNGGYNPHEVFVKNYLNIWHEFVDKGLISSQTYAWLKRDIMLRFIVHLNYKYLFLRRNVSSIKQVNSRNNFSINGSFKILYKYYGKNLYYWLSYFMFIKFYIGELYRTFQKRASK